MQIIGFPRLTPFVELANDTRKDTRKKTASPSKLTKFRRTR